MSVAYGDRREKSKDRNFGNMPYMRLGFHPYKHPTDHTNAATRRLKALLPGLYINAFLTNTHPTALLIFAPYENRLTRLR